MSLHEHMYPKDSNEIKKNPKYSKKFQKIPETSKKNSKNFQNIPKYSKRVQKIPKGSIALKIVKSFKLKKLMGPPCP